MSAISVKEIAGAVADSEMKFTPQGKAVTKVRLAFSDPFFNEDTRQWESRNQFFVEATAWERTAEQLADVAVKGAQILVWGKLVTDQWEDRQTGEKRSKPALKIKGFRPLGKLPETGAASPGGASASGGWGDPQATTSPTGAAQPADNWGGQRSGEWGGWQ